MALLNAGCAALGYREEYDVRLEHPDGRLVRSLYSSGDADGCDELAWSPDGRTLAVLTGHVARVRFVDVASAVHHPEVATAPSYMVDLSSEQRRVESSHLRLVGPFEAEMRVCQARQGGACDATASVRRFCAPHSSAPAVRPPG
jgi:hypothetical protein